MEQNRDKFLWRPNDNSVTTKLRYDLEAGHWLDSIKSAQAETTVTLSEFLGVIGLILSFVINIFIFIVLSIVAFVKWVRPTKKQTSIDIPTFDDKPSLSFEEIDEIIDSVGNNRTKI